MKTTDWLVRHFTALCTYSSSLSIVGKMKSENCEYGPFHFQTSNARSTALKCESLKDAEATFGNAY